MCADEVTIEYWNLCHNIIDGIDKDMQKKSWNIQMSID